MKNDREINTLYKTQELTDICEFIINNRNDDYKTLISKVSERYGYRNIYGIKRKLTSLYEYNTGLVNITMIVLNHAKMLSSGEFDKDLDDKFKKIGGVYYKSLHRNEKLLKLDLNFQTKEGIQKHVDRACKIVELKIQGLSDEDISEIVKISAKSLENYLYLYIIKAPEMLAKYIIFKADIKPYNSEEVKEVKERINFYLSNVEKNIINLDNYVNGNYRQHHNFLAKLNSYKELYKNILLCLSLEKRMTPAQLRGIDDDIVMLCKNLSDIMLYEGKLKKPDITESNLEIAKKVYKKELNLILPEEKRD